LTARILSNGASKAGRASTEPRLVDDPAPDGFALRLLASVLDLADVTSCARRLYSAIAIPGPKPICNTRCSGVAGIVK
jgi:hypothetical protein